MRWLASTPHSSKARPAPPHASRRHFGGVSKTRALDKADAASPGLTRASLLWSVGSREPDCAPPHGGCPSAKPEPGSPARPSGSGGSRDLERSNPENTKNFTRRGEGSRAFGRDGAERKSSRFRDRACWQACRNAAMMQVPLSDIEPRMNELLPERSESPSISLARERQISRHRRAEAVSVVREASAHQGCAPRETEVWHDRGSLRHGTR